MTTTFREIDATELNSMLGNAAVILIDVRNDDEVARGIIPGARHIPLTLLPDVAREFVDGEAPLVFYCHSGMRSAQACMLLCQASRNNVFNLRGGILGWGKAGLPFVTKS